MKISTSYLRNLTVALVIGVLSLGFAPTAGAIATYDALAELSLGLTGVNNADGSPVTEGWSVLAYESRISSFSKTDADGDASATIVPTLITVPVSLGVGDIIFQSAESFGEATDGGSLSNLLTDLGIMVDNLSNQDLTFTFDYDASTEAAVSGSVVDGDDASADAQLQLFDELGSIAISLLPFAELADGILSDSLLDVSSFSFTLPSGESNEIGAFIDAFGDATAEAIQGVPEPSILPLIGVGLFGMGFARKRIKF